MLTLRRNSSWMTLLATTVTAFLAIVPPTSAHVAQPASPPSGALQQANTVCALSPDIDGPLFVWRYDGTGTSWTPIRGGPFAQLYGGGYGLFATRHATGDIYRYNGSNSSWSRIGGPGATFAVTNSALFGLSPDRSGVWRYNGTGTSWTYVGLPGLGTDWMVPCP
jgi:hypothetical protein